MVIAVLAMQHSEAADFISASRTRGASQTIGKSIIKKIEKRELKWYHGGMKNRLKQLKTEANFSDSSKEDIFIDFRL